MRAASAFARGVRAGWGLQGEPLVSNFQAATLMHELGHTLGLRHNGGANTDSVPLPFRLKV